MTPESSSTEFPVPMGFYELTPATLVPVIYQLPEVAGRIGGASTDWRITEISDGNMNAVFRIAGPKASVIAKQALPYIRVIGKSWPFPISRIDYEDRALREHGRVAGRYLPQVYAYLPQLGLIVMQDFAPHIIARKAFIAGQYLPHLAADLGDYLARSLFFTSDFALSMPQKMALTSQFCDNSVLCETTADVIFAGPYWAAPMNRVTSGNEPLAAVFHTDNALKLAAAEMAEVFRTRAQALIHGDLHTGSLMVTATETRVIDPEWAFCGPMGFDIGALLGNLLLACFSQPGHATAGNDRKAYADWLLQTLTGTWAEFSRNFHAFAAAVPTRAPLFDAQTAELFISRHLAAVFADSVGFAGAKMIRRIIGISHVEDFEAIRNVPLRAACEARALTAARLLLLNRTTLTGPDDIVTLVQEVQVRG
ncbi:MAG: S-methyl-5-thioribose kinase [Paracoccaceae bacterium]|nr:S-methyl-5-thioribose kinase [Paracoccaceae bacterium]